MSGAAEGYWPLMRSYHRARESLYRQIISEALPDTRPDAAILDAGCGDAFYCRLLAEELGTASLIVALDRSRSLLDAGPSPRRIQPCQGDMEQPGLRPQTFDTIWLCRALHSADDPPRRLLALARLLRPGGRLIVVENDYAHHPLLGWPADFERRVLGAHYLYLESRSPNVASLERYHGARHLPAWLRQAGLEPVSLHTYVTEDLTPLQPEVEEYWRLFLGWLGCRIWAYLSLADQHRYLTLSDPNSADYMLAQPNAYCLELTTVGCGVAPE